MDQMVNYIWLACILRTYKTYNSTIGFSKYEFNNKLLGGITLLRVTSSVTWTPIYIYIYIKYLSTVTQVSLLKI